MITFRPVEIETDAPALARIYNCTVTEPVSAETIRDMWVLRPGEVNISTLAVDENGNALGYWYVDRETHMRPGHWLMGVVVAPEARGQGLGGQMYAQVLAVAREQGVLKLETQVREEDEASQHIAQKRGFVVERHSFESVLDLTTFDESRFSDLRERVRAFRFFSLAEAGVTEENKRKLYAVNRASGLDNPGNHGTFPDYESFSLNVFEASWFRPETQILAADGDTWAGISAISINEETGSAFNAFTGVLREYRGRGLAQALKLHTILLARKMGMRTIRTNNDSENAPILRVNRKLGYQPVPGIYRLICRLAESPSEIMAD